MKSFLGSGVIRFPKSYLKVLLLSIAVYFSYSPFTIATGGDGLSANYFFIFIPLFYLIKDLRLLTPNNDLLLVMFSFFALFILAAIIQFEYWEIFYRKFISFILFFTIFLFAFIRIDSNLILAFKIGTVFFTLSLALDNLLEYRSFDVQELGYAAKNQVGNQRYGFMFVFSFWMVLFFQTKNNFLNLVKIPLLILIFTGIFLTFSRSSIVAFSFSAMVLAWHFIASKNIFNLRVLILILIYSSLAFLIIFFTGYYEYLFIPFEFFSERFYELFSGEGINLDNIASSEGYRIYLLREILGYVLSNPIYGSGHLGIWILFEDQVGSAHGQFNDVLFRTGIIGLFIYFYLLFKLIRFLKSYDFSMYIGLWGIIAYGLFHETFKLGHGAFVLAFLIGIWASAKRMNSQNLEK